MLSTHISCICRVNATSGVKSNSTSERCCVLFQILLCDSVMSWQFATRSLSEWRPWSKTVARIWLEESISNRWNSLNSLRFDYRLLKQQFVDSLLPACGIRSKEMPGPTTNWRVRSSSWVMIARLGRFMLTSNDFFRPFFIDIDAGRSAPALNGCVAAVGRESHWYQAHGESQSWFD